MLQRSTFSIDPCKGDSFKEFIKRNAKDKSFWDGIKKEASKPIDKIKLDEAFNKKGKDEL